MSNPMSRFGFALNVQDEKYYAGMPFSFFVTAINQITREATLEFSGPYHFTFTISDDTSVIFSASGAAGGGGATNIVLAPRAIYTFQHDIDPAPNARLGATFVIIEATIHSTNYGFSARLNLPIGT